MCSPLERPAVLQNQLLSACNLFILTLFYAGFTSQRGQRVPAFPGSARSFYEMLYWLVGRWSRATQSCETRQVRKEATAAGQCVCSGQLAPGLLGPDSHDTSSA